MQSTLDISEKQKALNAVQNNGEAISVLSPKLKSNIAFVWDISRIQSKKNDDLRKKYVNEFFIKEGLKLFIAISTAVIGGLFIAGVIALPIPFLVSVLLSTLSGLYAINKTQKHFKGLITKTQVEAVDSNQQQVKVLSPLEKQPKEILNIIQAYAGESNLKYVTKEMYKNISQNSTLNKFLERVAFGMQDEVEQLFTNVFLYDSAKIQEALKYQGKFTDYSGRTFNCSAYEYAYWAKDTHMCRMLERYMDEHTKAIILDRITTNDQSGLSYQQNGNTHQSAHFDLTPLKVALRAYVNLPNNFSYVGNWVILPSIIHPALYQVILQVFNENRERRIAHWMEVGKAQRDVPAHVAQEYCRPDRSFSPCPKFNEDSLPRVLSLETYISRHTTSWFPNQYNHYSNYGFWREGNGAGLWWRLGFDKMPAQAGDVPLEERFDGDDDYLLTLIPGRRLAKDLSAITRLDEVRTKDLEVSRENLSPAASPRMGF